MEHSSQSGSCKAAKCKFYLSGDLMCSIHGTGLEFFIGGDMRTAWWSDTMLSICMQPAPADFSVIRPGPGSGVRRRHREYSGLARCDKSVRLCYITLAVASSPRPLHPAHIHTSHAFHTTHPQQTSIESSEHQSHLTHRT